MRSRSRGMATCSFSSFGTTRRLCRRCLHNLGGGRYSKRCREYPGRRNAQHRLANQERGGTFPGGFTCSSGGRRRALGPGRSDRARGNLGRAPCGGVPAQALCRGGVQPGGIADDAIQSELRGSDLKGMTGRVTLLEAVRASGSAVMISESIVFQGFRARKNLTHPPKTAVEKVWRNSAWQKPRVTPV